MARPFADIVRELGSGQAYEDLTSALGEIATGVMLHRKTGELTLKLKVTPNGEGSVFVDADIKAKVPEPARARTLFFATSSGSLVRNDPRQDSLPLRQVTETEELRREATHG
jgi:hypothetical protein